MANSWQPKLDCEETLDILREISANPYVTQRQMSARTEISLGKVNFLIRALIEKGLVKTENFLTSEHKAAFIYRLTPAGIEERERITVRFLRKKSEEYERLKEDIRLLEQDVAAADGLSGSRDGFQSAG
ncbi:MAG: MarR family EPS-associated transcriptional regulator [Syntrophales bacterium]|jgi:EPS-associated MarR family transcriptional regulator|nr:MarR family EPS-associated transcriptional regulator [Syntrophales bacterium]